MEKPTYISGVSGEDYEPTTIAEMGEMIGKVALSVIWDNTAENHLSDFDKGFIENGDTIEQAVSIMAESLPYDKQGTDALKRENSKKFEVLYFKDWNRVKFKKTVDIPEIRKVLTKDKTAADVAAKIVSTMTEGDIQEKYENTRDLFDWATDNNYIGKIVTVPYDSVNSSIDYKETLVAMKDGVSGMKFVNTEYNVAGLKRRTRKEDIRILIPYALKNRIDVEELAGVFNLDKSEIKDKIIETDSVKDSDGNYRIIITDIHAVLAYTRLYEMIDEKNGDGLFWNYYLHVERMYAFCGLFDSLCIKVATTVPNEETENND